jgi:hypothetical protein
MGAAHDRRPDDRRREDAVPQVAAPTAAGVTPAPAGGADSILALQRSAGNAAVARLMRRTLARDGEGTVEVSAAGGAGVKAPPAPTGGTPAPPGVDPKVHAAKEAKAGKRDTGTTATMVIWQLVAEVAPGEGRKLAGSRYEAKVTVAPDFGSDPTRLPMMQVGDKLLDLLAAEKIGEAGVEVRMAFDKVDDIRVQQKLVDAEDLKKASLVAKLRLLPEDQKLALIAATKDDAVRAYVKNLGISTPVPGAATRQADGAVSTTINGMSVVIEQDTGGGAETHTSVRTERVPAEIRFNWNTDRAGRVTDFTPNPVAPQLTVRIKTTFAPGENAQTPSGYGKGTTPADKAAGTTTLGFHEGSHGTDYLAFLGSHPYPVFRGRVGDTQQAFQQAVAAWNTATRAWHDDMHRESVDKTDCVGSPTIDQFHANQAGYHNVCRPRR